MQKAKRGIRNEWWTPLNIRERVLAEFNIGLDAAACADSALVPNWLGPSHTDPERRDATAMTSWAALTPAGSVVWNNAPYAPAGLIEAFLHTSAATAADGVAVVALVPAATSTNWWHRGVVQTGAKVEFITGRLRFTGPHADGNPAPFASALLVWEAQ